MDDCCGHDLDAQLIREIQKIFCDDVVSSRRWHLCRFIGYVFEWTVDECRAQPVLLRGLEIMLVGRDHHDLFGLEVEQLGHQAINGGVAH